MCAVTTLSHLGICYWFVIGLDFGLKGAALALNINYLVFFVSIYVYTMRSELVSDRLADFDSSAFLGLHEILRFGLPNAALVFLEWG